MNQQLTFVDMFAGIGGFHSGMEQAGHKCVGWIEWDKYARQSYEAIYDTKGIFTGNDIRQIWGGRNPYIKRLVLRLSLPRCVKCRKASRHQKRNP